MRVRIGRWSFRFFRWGIDWNDGKHGHVLVFAGSPQEAVKKARTPKG